MLYISLLVALSVQSANTHQGYNTVDTDICTFNITGTICKETYIV
jgi:hypothetical protein